MADSLQNHFGGNCGKKETGEFGDDLDPLLSEEPFRLGAERKKRGQKQGRNSQRKQTGQRVPERPPFQTDQNESGRRAGIAIGTTAMLPCDSRADPRLRALPSPHTRRIAQIIRIIPPPTLNTGMLIPRRENRLCPQKKSRTPETITALPLFRLICSRSDGVHSAVSDKKVDRTANGFRRISIFNDVAKKISISSLSPSC